MRSIKKVFGFVAGVALGGVAGLAGGAIFYAIDAGDAHFSDSGKKILEAARMSEQSPEAAAAELAVLMDNAPAAAMATQGRENIMKFAAGLALAGGVAGAALSGRKKKGNAPQP